MNTLRSLSLEDVYFSTVVQSSNESISLCGSNFSFMMEKSFCLAASGM